MKAMRVLLISLSIILIIIIIYKPKPLFSFPASKPKGCVFNTVFGVTPLDTTFIYFPTSNVTGSINKGMEWLKEAQQKDGGWGAGFHNRQNIRDPHAVPTDPATTAIVAMSLLRTGTTLEKGPYKEALQGAVEYLLKAVESTPPDGSSICKLNGTQIQRKLGKNIDMIMATQFFTNLLSELKEDTPIYERVFNAMNKSVDVIQQLQDANGKIRGAGWAGVLQSALANNALESAQVKGGWVDEDVLDMSREYQKGNYNPKTGQVSATDGAGVVLYAVSGSARACAKEARKARAVIKEGKTKGLLVNEDEVSMENLVKAGLNKDKALKYYSSYKIYESAKIKAQTKKVMTGFGNNGGEEFISYLQTGESLIINKDVEWKKWFSNVSGQLLNIQNNDGSWSGHHCITSPVFCTATCVLILSVNNDIDELLNLGE